MSRGRPRVAGDIETNGLKLYSAKNDDSQEKPAIVRYAEWLHEPVHSSTIAIFRMLYALCVMAQLGIWSDMYEDFNKSYAVFPYPMMGWVRPLSPGYGHMLINACYFFAILQLIGLFTPVSTFGVFFTFSWLFFTCESNHNNHYLLMVHLTFCGAFLGWGKWLSVDQLIRANFARHPDPRVPRWSLLVVRLIFCIPYLYGAFAKMNYDWIFRAQPIKMWFEGRGGIYEYSLFHWFICYSGCGFDLIISFLLWWRPTRYLVGFPAALCFNISNKIMLNIGIFPLMMIASLILFLEPHHPAQLLAFILRRKVYGLPSDPTEAEANSKRDDDGADKGLKTPLMNGSGHSSRRGSSILDQTHGLLTLRQWWGVIFFTSFCIFHAFNPLREKVLYPDNPSWTEEGHFGAWHMKLRSKRGLTVLNLEEEDGTVHMLDPLDDKVVEYDQIKKVPHKPHMTILYVNRLRMLFEAAGRPLKSIKAESCFSLNDREHHQLFIPDANLLHYAGTKYEWLGVTGVGKFLYGDEQGPKCKKSSILQKYDKQAAKRMLDEVREQAGIILTRDGHGRRVIKRKVSEGVVEDAYLWPMF